MTSSSMRNAGATLLLALLALPAAAEPCSAQRGFDLGRAGVTADPACSATAAFTEAHALGEELARLEHARAEALRQQAAATGAEANTHARTARWLGVDIEAIEGALLLRGIVSTGPSAATAAAAGSPPQTTGDDPEPTNEDSR